MSTWNINFSGFNSNDAYFEYDKKTNTVSLRIYNSTKSFSFDKNSLSGITYAIQFDDTTWSNIEEHIVISSFGSEKNDRITGNGIWRDIIYADEGNDVISNFSGSVVGGKGNDTIHATQNGSADTVYFTKGDGHDVIYGQDNTTTIATDTLYLKGISASNTTWVRKGTNLVFNFTYDDGTAADSVTLMNFFAAEKYQTFHKIVFEADGYYYTDLRQNFTFEQHGTEKGSTLTGTPWRNKIYGGSGNDIIIVKGVENYVEGGDGNDCITGTGTLIGGKGNDTINIQEAGKQDLIFFAIGDGKDVINSLDNSKDPNNRAVDTLQFGAGITKDDLSYERKGNNLIIYVKGKDSGDQITINNFFKGDQYQTLHQFEFTQYMGGVLTIVDRVNDIRDSNQYVFNIIGTEKNDTIISTPWANHIDAGDGNDRITGSGTIVGGKGNDVITLNIKDSQDTIIFNIGDGKDTINSNKTIGLTDTLRFGTGITKNDLTFERKGNNLVIYVKGRDSGDQITVNNYFKGGQFQTIHKFEFTNATGQVIVAQTINDIRDSSQFTFTLEGTAKNDAIVGTPWASYIDAGDGNDRITGSGTIVGGKGNDVITLNVKDNQDTIIFNLGDGKDTINSNKNISITDTLRFGTGITKNDLTFERKGNNLVIYVKGRDSGDQITVNNYFKGGQFQTIHKFEFTNATGQVIVAQTINDIRDSSQFTFILEGTAKNDAIVGMPWANYIDAGDGNDRITGSGTIVGGKGNDVITLNVKDSQDIIIFNIGDGKDIINSNKNIGLTDTLRFGPNITRDDLTYERKGNNLVIYIKGKDSGDQITITNFFKFKGEVFRSVHKFEFTDANGNVIPSQTINDIRNGNEFSFIINGTNKNDNIIGAIWSNYIDAGDGNDKITMEGSGTVIGGKGNDTITLNGGGGWDTIIFNAGDGKDIINSNKASAIDTLRFGNGITKDDLTYERKGNNLVIYVKGRDSGDQITINNYFKASEHQTIQKFEFMDVNGQVIPSQTINDIRSDNYIFTFEGINGKNNTILGSQINGKDYIIGGDRNDNITGSGTIIGGEGNDVINIKTNGSSDTIIFNKGDGKDVINSYDTAAIKGEDMIQFGSGITASMISTEKKGNNLIIYIDGKDSADQITINNYFKGADYQTIQKIKLADNTVLNAYFNGNGVEFVSGLRSASASLENQANGLIDAMAAFAPQSSADSLIDEKTLDLNSTLIAVNV